jgi:hypothetical protein
MENYFLYNPKISIPIGGHDVIIGIQWLKPLGTMIEFSRDFMRFFLKGKEIKLRGI